MVVLLNDFLVDFDCFGDRSEHTLFLHLTADMLENFFDEQLEVVTLREKIELEGSLLRVILEDLQLLYLLEGVCSPKRVGVRHNRKGNVLRPVLLHEEPQCFLYFGY
jgi:hypothetical protein